MRKLSLVLGGAVLALTMACTVPAYADAAAAGTPVTCKDGTAGKAGKGACSHHGGVDKSAGAASSSAPVSAPAAAAPAPSAATAATSGAAAVICKDGSTGKAGKGACSHHGGVDKSGGAAASSAPATPAPAPTVQAPAAPAPSAPTAQQPSAAAPTTAPASSANASNTDATGATAKCKDGTYSHSKHHSGSCSHHGGVAQFLQ